MGKLIEIQGSKNLRDLGPFSNLDKKLLQTGIFFRSASLHDFSKESLKKLKSDYKIRTILDLRAPEEIEDSVEGIMQELVGNYFNIDLVVDLKPLLIPDFSSVNERLVRHHENLRFEEHELWLNERKVQLREIFNLFSRKELFPILYHCAGGKDRTGLVSGLLLSLLGVNTDMIVDDYGVSSKYLYDHDKQTNAAPFSTWKQYQDFASPPKTMYRTLSYIETKFGGTYRYLKSIGMTDTQLTDIISNAV
jgi:protein tyrosine/serine phosphatase